MNLLLLLTALFASLTGMAAGERGVRAVQDVTVVQVATAAHAAVQPARVIPGVSEPERLRPEQVAGWPKPARALVAEYLPFERRLE